MYFSPSCAPVLSPSYIGFQWGRLMDDSIHITQHSPLLSPSLNNCSPSLSPYCIGFQWGPRVAASISAMIQCCHLQKKKTVPLQGHPISWASNGGDYWMVKHTLDRHVLPLSPSCNSITWASDGDYQWLLQDILPSMVHSCHHQEAASL